MNKKHLIPLFILVFSIGFTYSNNLKNEFLWDDEFLIEKNVYLTDFKYIPQMMISNSTAGFGGKDNFYRPTQTFFYFMIYQGFGLNPIAFHVGNILIHILNALLLYLLLFKLFNCPLLALSTSLLWGLHPTHVEAVTYISGTADPLGLLFFLLAALSLPLNDHSQKVKKVFLSCLFFLLSLLSKEAMIVSPALLCLILFLKSSQSKSFKTYMITLPHWILALFYLLLRQTVLNFDKTFDFYKTSNIYTESILYRFFTYLATIPEYLKILFLPLNLHMERSFPVHVDLFNTPVLFGLFITLFTFLISLFFLVKKKKKDALFCWLWFFIAFVPMNGILMPVNSFILEHWLYLPSLTFFIIISFFIHQISLKNYKAAQVILLTTCLYLSFFTIQRNYDWENPITFYSNILKYSKGSARVHNNIAMAYSDKKMWVEAIDHYKKAIESSDEYAQTHYNLARLYIQRNDLDLALKHLDRSLIINPKFDYSTKLKAELLEFMSKKKNP